MIQAQRDKQSKAGAGFRRNEWNVILGDLRAGEVLKVERRSFAENLARALSFNHRLQPLEPLCNNLTVSRIYGSLSSYIFERFTGNTIEQNGGRNRSQSRGFVARLGRIKGRELTET